MLVLFHITGSLLGSYSPLAGIFPPSPPMLFGTAMEQGPKKVTQISSGCDSSCELQKEAEKPKHTRRQRLPVPEEQKDARYWELRRRNNISAKRSREARRATKELELHRRDDAIIENISLRAEINVLRSELNSLRQLLKDTNTILSLWIRARQTTEPVNQLPPTASFGGYHCNAPF